MTAVSRQTPLDLKPGHSTLGEVEFEAVIERMRPRLRSVLIRYQIPRLDGEDLLQEASLALWRQRCGVQDPSGWLLGTLRHLCLQYLRGQMRRRIESVDPELLLQLAGAASETPASTDLRLDLMQAVGKLPARQRRIVNLYYRAGLTEDEMALLLKTNVQWLFRHRWRAIARLRELLRS